MKSFTLFTANAAAIQSVCMCANAQPVLDTPEDGWFLIAPYGEHPSPDGSYVQVFQRSQAERMVTTWNSLTGRVARWTYNLRHRGQIGNMGSTVWEGHPDVDPARWPAKLHLADISALRAGENGLEGQTTWNSENMARRGRGPLKPSPFWVHEAPDANGRVYPEMLLSVGLVPTPNISDSPAWTPNADDPDGNNKPQTQKAMNQSEIAKALGLEAEASWDQIREALQSLKPSTANATALATANAATLAVQQQLGTVTTERNTLQGTVTQLTTANAGLTTTNTTLTTANATLLATANGLGEQLALAAERAALFTPAERDTWKGRLTINSTGDKPVTAESVLAAAKELGAKKPAFNTLPIGALTIAAPASLATANAAAATFEGKVAALAKERNISRGAAWDAAMEDPANASLVQAMRPPTA